MTDTLLTPRFHLKGTSLQAWRTLSGGTGVPYTSSASAGSVASVASSDTGAFGSAMISLANTSYLKTIQYPAKSNWSDVAAFSVLMRIIPRWTGAPSASEQGFFDVTFPTNGGAVGVYAGMDTNGKPYMGIYDKYGTAYMNPNTDWSTAYTSFVSGTAVDLLFIWDGTTNPAKFYVNGTLIVSLTPAAGSPAVNNQQMAAIVFGMCHTGGTLSNYDLNEAAIWDYALSSTDITNLTARSTFIASTQFDATLNTDPGASNVVSTASYYSNGVLVNGNVVLPTAATVESGVAFGSSSSLNGTCAVPTPSQTLNGVPVGSSTGNVILPANADTRYGVSFGPSGSCAGSCWVPTASQTLAGVNVDATEGNVVLPTELEVELSITFGPASSLVGSCAVPTPSETLAGVAVGSSEGNVVLPATTDTRHGVEFGPSSGLTGSCYVPTASETLAGVNVDATEGDVVLPATIDTRYGVEFGPASDLVGSCYVPTASETLNGVSVDATEGNVVLPATTDVRSLVEFGPTSGLTGSCAVPTASETLNGIPVDATDGNVVLPTAPEVLSTAMFGPEAATAGTAIMPVEDTVLADTVYGPDGDLTGTFAPIVINNVMTQMQLQQNPTTPLQALVITQGDEFPMAFEAIADTGLPFNLTGATFSTKMLNEDGTTYTTWDNGAHTLNPDQTTYPGQFTLDFGDTSSLEAGPVREIITTVVSGGDTIHFHGTIEVLSSEITS